jgi:hypothetical protein
VRNQIAKAPVALQIIVSALLRFCCTLSRSRAAFAAENRFLRKQFALFEESEKNDQPCQTSRVIGKPILGGQHHEYC